jgi:gluconate 2-dehydrogenase subunit 3-like protein
MGGQTIARREIVRLLGIAAVAATFPGFSRWSFAGTAEEPAPAGDGLVSRNYRPLFFSPLQLELIEHLAEMIIPADDTPGARQAGVGEFIDFMVANRVPISGSGHPDSPRDSAVAFGSELQRQWLEGLAWIDAHCTYEFGRDFLKCSAAQQDAVLTALAYKSKYTPATEPGREFFRLLRDYTVTGYYTSRIGMESLGVPGLRSAWDRPPGCPHQDDPEHRRLLGK